MNRAPSFKVFCLNKNPNHFKEINHKNKNPKDPRKHPRPGYDEKNPSSKKNIQDHPENQNSG